jgi:putative ABC transport system permease protein
MTQPNGPRKLFRVPSTRATVGHEIDDEMRFHLDARREELERLGHSPDDARRIALEEFGDVRAARAELAAIDRRRVGRVDVREWLSSWSQDVRFALRGLRARPGFSLTILLTLALGVGANAAIFSIIDSVLLRPLPFAEPARLVHLWETYTSNVGGRSEASYPDYEDWRARTRSFSGLAGYQPGNVLIGGAEPATVRGVSTSANFFDVLGVKPMLGRAFLPGEDAVGAPRIVLLTYGCWRSRFAGDSSIVGREIAIDGAPATVIGVLPREFQFARVSTAEVWTPTARTRQTREGRGNHWFNVIGRLRPGVSIDGARQDLSRVMRDLAREYPQTNIDRQSQVVPLRDEFVGTIRPLLVLLYSAVVIVLLVACVNVANLLLIRGADREREMAVRVALGAGRARLVRQLLTESFILAVIGGGLGLLVAKAGGSALISLIPAAQMRGLPAIDASQRNWSVVLYTLLVSVAAGFGFGLVPALRFTRSSLSSSMRAGGRGATGGMSRLRDALVIGEIALTIILMSGAVLFGRSLMRLAVIDTGFQPEQVVTTTVVLPAQRYNSQQRVQALDRLLARMREIPGITSVAMTSKLPLDPGNSTSFAIAGQPAPLPGRAPDASYRTIAGDYLGTIGNRILAGRTLKPSDDANAPPVLVINRAFADAYLGGRDAIGQGIIVGADTFRVVGVAANVPIAKLEDKVTPAFYVPFARISEGSMAIVLRTQRDAGLLAPELHKALASVDPGIAMSAPIAMKDFVTSSPSIFLRRFPLFLMAAFAATALLLAIVGIYGVVSYSVSQRTREMGIRMALGAQPGSLVALVVRHGLWMAAVGIVVGIGGALLASRFAEKMLYGVSASDPVTYAVVAAVLASVAIAASVVPARRASRVDPSLALRAE